MMQVLLVVVMMVVMMMIIIIDDDDVDNGEDADGNERESGGVEQNDEH